MGGIKIVARHTIDDTNLMIELPSGVYKQKLMEIIKVANEKCNGYLSVEINRPYKKRTTGENSQNNLFWKLCTMIANEVGDDSEGMKDTENGIKLRALSRGYSFHVNKLTGAKEPESMTKINTVEMSYLIDTALQLCSELGIVVEQSIRQEVKSTESLVQQALEIQSEIKQADEYTGDIF